jgi:hypothetical protein
MLLDVVLSAEGNNMAPTRSMYMLWR